VVDVDDVAVRVDEQLVGVPDLAVHVDRDTVRDAGGDGVGLVAEHGHRWHAADGRTAEHVPGGHSHHPQVVTEQRYPDLLPAPGYVGQRVVGDVGLLTAGDGHIEGVAALMDGGDRALFEVRRLTGHVPLLVIWLRRRS
jgi:hypothetical protein